MECAVSRNGVALAVVRIRFKVIEYYKYREFVVIQATRLLTTTKNSAKSIAFKRINPFNIPQFIDSDVQRCARRAQTHDDLRYASRFERARGSSWRASDSEGAHGPGIGAELRMEGLYCQGLVCASPSAVTMWMTLSRVFSTRRAQMVAAAARASRALSLILTVLTRRR